MDTGRIQMGMMTKVLDNFFGPHEKMAPSFYINSSKMQIYQLIFGNQKCSDIFASETSLVYCWVFGQ